VFGEVDIPIVSPQMNVPLVNKFEIDVSGRYDDYSDVGAASNPKFAADWEVIGEVPGQLFDLLCGAPD
jgi:hypothetical protein